MRFHQEGPRTMHAYDGGCACDLPAIWVYELFCPRCGLRFYAADGCTCGCAGCGNEALEGKGACIWAISVEKATGELQARQINW